MCWVLASQHQDSFGRCEDKSPMCELTAVAGLVAIDLQPSIAEPSALAVPWHLELRCGMAPIDIVFKNASRNQSFWN